MPRKQKSVEKHAVRKSITIPPSLNRWLVKTDINTSKVVQVHVAEDVTRMEFSEFQKLYSMEQTRLNRNHPTDSIISEFIRVARWMLEGTILDHYYLGNSTDIGEEATTLLLVVKWGNGTTCKVSTNLAAEGFTRVIYDEEIYTYKPDVDAVNSFALSIQDVVGPEQGDEFPYSLKCLNELKARLVIRWMQLSQDRLEGGN